MDLATLRTELNKQIIAGTYDTPLGEISFKASRAARSSRSSPTSRRSRWTRTAPDGQVRLREVGRARPLRGVGTPRANSRRAPAQPAARPQSLGRLRRHVEAPSTNDTTSLPAGPQRPGHRQRLRHLRARLHAGLLHPAHHQLRPRRHLHARRLLHLHADGRSFGFNGLLANAALPCGLPFSWRCSAARSSPALCGVVVERLAFRPLRARGADPLLTLVSSLGVAVAIVNIIQYLVGAETYSYPAIRLGHLPARSTSARRRDRSWCARCRSSSSPCRW